MMVRPPHDVALSQHPAEPILRSRGPVLITGGAGFLGRFLAQRLSRSGCSVTVLDDLSCSNSTFDCPELIADTIHPVTGSVFDRSLVAELVDRHPVVIHFASVVGVEETISRSLATVENLNGTMNVARALTPDHVVMFGSSADVYGIHSRLYDRAMREDDLFVYEDARVNRWVYPHVKSLEENLISQSLARSVVVRVFNCYGPQMDYPIAKRVIPQFIERILRHRPLRLSGDGMQRRSFCYVDDMIDGFVNALNWISEQERATRDCFNLGHPEPITIRDLAHQVNLAAVKVGLIERPLPVVERRLRYSRDFDDSWHRMPDISRAVGTFGFHPRVKLADGLERTLEHYRAAAPAHRAASAKPRGNRSGRPARARGTRAG